MIIKLAIAMVIVFIILPLLILGFALITHMLMQVYFWLKEDYQELLHEKER
jgi:hypothetical protein